MQFEPKHAVYRPGEQALLQLSSCLQSSGDQVGALVRLPDRISKDAQEQIHIDQNVDQAAAEYLGPDLTRLGSRLSSATPSDDLCDPLKIPRALLKTKITGLANPGEAFD